MTVETQKKEIHLYIQQVCIGKRKPICRRVPFNTSNVIMHWAKKAEWKKAWQDEVGWAFLTKRNEFGQLPLKKPSICILIKSTHLKDKDGLYTSTKPLWDGLKNVNVILDDNPKNVKMEVKQTKVKHRNEEGVEIIIKDRNNIINN